VSDRLRLSVHELEQYVRDQIKAAVQARLMSDVPLGAFLSGGIDSSCIVAFMSQGSSRPVRTFSVGFSSAHAVFDERAWARIAADAFKTQHQELKVEADVATVLPGVVRHMDEPFGDSSSILTYLISQVAREHVTVVLTGIGGDEVFGGYPRYLGAWMSLAYERLPLALRAAAAKLAGAMLTFPSKRDSGAWIRRFLQGGALPADERYLLWRTYVTPQMKQALYHPDWAQAVGRSQTIQAMREVLAAGGEDYLDRIGRVDLETYLPDDLLAMGDRMSMAHGLEVRVPFCDHRLIEAMASVPMQRRMPGGRLKGLLRRSLSSVLPAQLLSKPKQGFMAPLATWLREDLADLCQEALSLDSVRRRGFFKPQAVEAMRQRHLSRRENLAQPLYGLLVLELWCREFLDGSDG
jgi:asparagine synthase (glutamine-hydrolysing)